MTPKSILDPAEGIEESEQSQEHGWLITWYRGEPISYEKHRKSARSFLRMLKAYTREPHRWDDDYKFLNRGTVRPIEAWFGSPPEVICETTQRSPRSNEQSCPKATPLDA